ncbi:Yap1 redox domain protein [Niveomyces insectorum RCEF 264]|uniref:Yap1 redox domain protein n=1 Tax=Niveomyces insectorum RCEF 264 TaxID=1081102 RepID=A0A167WYR7_9HYPO|nr:Yap1 redox domain protein [Niveomyces insectorum RCEF 264]
MQIDDDPDSRPALTRRQELNRQAQRTHRERKELYIKALEDEVLRLKEIYSNVSQDKERLAEENRQLKHMLSQSGATLPAGVPRGGSSLLDDTASNPSISFSASASGSYAAAPSSHTSAFTPPPFGTQGQRGMISPQHGEAGHGLPHSHGSGQTEDPRKNAGIDYEQAGIDFVLTLEKPCMDHMPWLLERGAEAGGEPCGHALMASCPPEPFPELTPDIPFGYSNVKGADIESGQRTWELTKGDLATLLALSAKLNLDGEITPVMAWGMVLAHPRLAELTLDDFRRLTDELGSKIRCYGFGAVTEEFEVRDALENIFCTKPDIFSPVHKPGFAMAF